MTARQTQRIYRPRIGVTGHFDSLEAPKAGAPSGALVRERLQVALAYGKAIKMAGGLATAIFPDYDDDGIDATLDGLDALVLTGGGDIDWSRYADRRSGAEDPHVLRDDFEFRLAARAIERGIPVLGVCRGAQLLVVLFGGTLVQDLADQGHRNTTDGYFSVHNVTAVPGTPLAEVVGMESFPTEHAHHQGAEVVRPPLMVTARSQDGRTIEGVGLPGDYRYVNGVQWHAEVGAGEQNRATDIAIWRDFVDHARAYHDGNAIGEVVQVELSTGIALAAVGV